MRSKLVNIVFMALIAGFAGADAVVRADDIRVTGAWARATPPGIEAGAAYFTVVNRGTDDRLVAVASPVAERVEMHRTVTTANVTRMRHEKSVDIEGGAEIAFAPGGRHVMLLGLERPLKDGDVFPLALTFEHAGTMEVQARVRGVERHRHDGH